mgnify:CR=1 FL=1
MKYTTLGKTDIKVSRLCVSRKVTLMTFFGNKNWNQIQWR